jgi:DNA invertase Pin-like site-specific DNA recombinase
VRTVQWKLDQNGSVYAAHDARAGIYCRVQRARQTSNDIRDQLSKVERFCTEYGWAITRHYYDFGSADAALSCRPGLSKAMEEGAAGTFDVLVVQHWDRLSRKIAIGELIYEHFTDCGVCIFDIYDHQIGPEDISPSYAVQFYRSQRGW